jgi:hypothetical protein
MGLYSKLVLPRVLDLAMRNSWLAAYRQTTIGAARGRVLEIGIGSGLRASAVRSAAAVFPKSSTLHETRTPVFALHYQEAVGSPTLKGSRCVQITGYELLR